MYESDITQFLRDLKAQKPELDQKQRDARAIWWDHPQDPETTSKNAESNLPQRAYVYQTSD